jgi:7-cyano-7-deazaguanine synthase in queuosine biosynthesis
MKSIVAFSGGLDSIYVLWKELTETSNEVTAVYFVTPPVVEAIKAKHKLQAFTNSGMSEALALKMQSLAAAIQSKARPFDMAVVPYDMSKIVQSDTGNNHAAVLRVKWAIDRINAGLADRFVSGHCRDNDGFSAKAHTTQEPATASSLSMDAFKKYATRGEYALPLQDMNYTIANAYAELPQELVDINLSCESAAFQDPCGVCYKCRMHQLAKDKLASGMTPEQFFAYTVSKNELPNGMWRSQKVWIAEEIPDYVPETDQDWPMPTWATSYKVPE